MSITFTTFLRTNQTGTFIEIPEELLAALGTKKRLPVHAMLNNYGYRTTVAVYDGRYYLPVRKEIREAAGLTVNDPVTVTLVADTEPRTVQVPDDLAQAFAADREAQSAFERLSFTHRKEYVAWIQDAKRAETRDNRIAKTILMLREGRKAP